MIKLFELRSEKGLSQRAVAKELLISQGTYNNWENGHTQPSIEQLLALSAFFAVSVDYLIGNTDEQDVIRAEALLSTEEKQLIRKYRSLPEDTRNLLLHFVEKLH